MIKMTSGPTSPPPDPTTAMTTFTGHTKGTTASESQIALTTTSKRVHNRDHQHFPSLRMISTMIPSRDLS